MIETTNGIDMPADLHALFSRFGFSDLYHPLGIVYGCHDGTLLGKLDC